jgi:hypothetical protein
VHAQWEQRGSVLLNGINICIHACTYLGAKFKVFSTHELVWDTCRGRQLPSEYRVEADDIASLDMLGESLLEARWRFASRQLYNRWFQCWESFALRWRCRVMPAKEKWLKRFFVFLTLHYAASTVQISASAVAALHRLNGFDSPLTPTLLGLLKAVQAVGVCGSRCKKFIVDASFVVSMCTDFLQQFPVYDVQCFDPVSVPTCDSERSIMWLRGVAIILIGLEVGARASEICRLTLCCWKPREDGSVYVAIKLAKNGKNGEEAGAVLVRGEGSFSESMSAITFFEEFYIPFLQDQGLGVSSACISDKFRTSVCPHCSPMFPVFKRGAGKRQVGPVGRVQVTEAVKKWAVKIGREAANYSAVSFRRGSVSIAAAEKVSRDIRKKHVRWKSEDMQDVYTEVSSKDARQFGEALRNAVSRSRRAKGKKLRFEFNT